MMNSNRVKNFMRQFAAIFAVVICLVSAGCQSMTSNPATWIDIPNGIPWDPEPRKTRQTPVRVASTWTDAVRNQAGKQSERGFGGRLFFYNRKDATPIEVEGQLVVYAFDEIGRLPTDHKPTRRYVFPAEQFAKHLSHDEDLGPSYSIWLPWDGAGGPPKKVSLIARFEPLAGGDMLVSEQSSHRLPGIGPEQTMIAEEEPTLSEIQRASFEELKQQAAAANERRRMETTSISLPSAIRARTSSGASSASRPALARPLPPR